MKYLLICIIAFTVYLAPAQSNTHDSVQGKVQGVFVKYGEDGDNKSAISGLTKIIEVDSEYYEIFYQRAFFLLLESEKRIFDSSNVGTGQSVANLLEDKAAGDLLRSIQTRFSNYKMLPFSSLDTAAEFNVPKSIEIQPLGLNEKHRFVIYGFLVYVTSHGKNKNLARECWEKASKAGVSGMDLLLNSLCE